jgi:hypothetical protein
LETQTGLGLADSADSQPPFLGSIVLVLPAEESQARIRMTQRFQQSVIQVDNPPHERYSL